MNAIQIFHYGNNKVRTIEQGGEPWFVLKDVCGVLDLGSPHKVSERLDEDERNRIPVTDSTGRQQETTVINESGLYNVILRSDKPEAKPFRKWVTSEVLPSIRKHGAYATPETIDKIISNPDFGISLLTALKGEQEKNLALTSANLVLEQRVFEYEPKVQYVDKILRSPGTLTIKQIAQDYGLTAQELNNILHEEHIQYKINGQWILYREHLGLGYTRSEPVPIIRSNGRSDYKLHTKWTQKGRYLIHGILTKRGILANMDRQATQIRFDEKAALEAENKMEA